MIYDKTMYSYAKENRAFVGTAFAQDTAKINSYFNSKVVREKYLPGLTPHWGAGDDTTRQKLFFTKNNYRITELDSTDIEYLTMKGNGYYSPLQPVYKLSCKLKNKRPIRSNNLESPHVFIFEIGDRTFTISVAGNLLKEEFTIMDRTPEDVAETLKKCYADKIK
jgi:hypothetical protein